jgi:hypothetical protein
MGTSRARRPLLVLAAVASGGALLNCLSWLNFGERKYHVHSEWHEPPPMTPEEVTAFRAREAARERFQQEQCAATIASLVRGDVFLAEGDRTPRADELLANECGPGAKRERADPAYPRPEPLLDTNPAACEELRTSKRAEGFSIRYEGNVLHWYYFTYEDMGRALRVLELYSKMPLMPPRYHAGCHIGVADVPDVGRFPMWYPHLFNTWGGFAIAEDSDSGQPDVISVRMPSRDLTAHRTALFRLSTKRLEVDSHDQ